MANFFDQFDEKVKEGGNFFDQFDEKEAPKKKSGVGASFQRGLEQVGSSFRTAAEAVTKGDVEAARAAQERQAEIESRLEQGGSLERLMKIYREEGLLPAAGELATQIPKAIAEQVPNILTTVGGAATGAAAGSIVPGVGTVAGGIAGALAPSLVQQYAGNIQRQLQAQEERGEPIDISSTKALGTAVPQAALDVAATFIPLGAGMVTRFFGPSVGKLLSTGGTEAAEKLAKETLLGTALRGTAVGIAAEVPTEVTQQMLERLQAGLDITSQDALQEYGETAFATALLGPIGIIGRVSNKAAAARQVAQAQQEAQADNEIKQIELETTDDKPAVLYVSPTGDVSQSIEELNEITRIKQLQAQQQPTVTEATTTPEADQRAIQERMVEGFRQQPGIQKIEADYQAVMADRDREQVAKSAFNTIVTPDVIKSFGVGPTAKIFQDTDLINADISNPDVADQVRAKLEAFAEKTTSQKVKDNIASYLDRIEFLTPSSIEEVLNVPQEIPKGAGDLQQFAFIDQDGKVKSVIGNIVKKNGKLYAKYPKGQRELTEDVMVNPNPDQIELLKLYKARDTEAKSEDDFKKWLMGYGIKPSERAEIGLEKKIPSKYFRNNGYGADELVLAAINDGILSEADFDFQGSVGGIESMREYIRRAMAGEFVPTYNNTVSMMNLQRIDDRIQALEESLRGAPEEVVAEQAIEAQQAPRYEAMMPSDKFIQEGKELAKEMRQALDKMGLKNVGLKFEETMTRFVDGKLDEVTGSYFNNLITASLSSTNVRRTINHEAIHAMKDLGFFTDAEWKILSNKAKSQWIKKYDPDGSRYGSEPMDIRIEEAIADAFADYRTQPANIKSIFDKMIDLMDMIRNYFAGRGFRTVDDVFKRAEEGRLEGKPVEPTAKPVKSERLERPSRAKVKAPLTGVDTEYTKKLLQQFTAEKATVKQRFEGLKDNFFERMVTGLFDEFRAIKKYGMDNYMKVRLSKSIDGGLQGLLEYGHVFNDNGALNIVPKTKGLMKILEPLGTEVDQYQMWKALSRDANLPKDKRSFPQDLLDGRDQLTKGQLNGKSRREIYEQAIKEENALNRSVLKVALDAGIIDKEGYDKFANDIYYIPFYKAMENGDVDSVMTSSKLTGQYFSKTLKGGEKKVNDLMENVLLNWSHILSAAMKNQAAVSTIKTAEDMGVAKVVKPIDGKFPPNSVKVMENGKTVHYELKDPDLVDAISTISYIGPKSMFLNVAREFTNALRYGVTLSPAYKIRNLIRDSMSSAAVSRLSANLIDNVYKGLALSDKGNPTYMSALVGGGIFEMGVAHEGNQAKMIKRLVDKGTDIGTILDTPEKVKSMLPKLLEWYNEQGNRFENANRLALYKKLREEGKTHLEASFQARDLMDFSLQGQFRAVKIISSVVPFFNARLQGLYKLGRDGVTPTYRLIYNTFTGEEVTASDKQKGQRFMAMSGAIMLASMALYSMYKDDEEFKKREDWDRDNFWWFKIGDTKFRIPKPFEIGALGTIAERTLEQISDDGVEGKVFFNRLNHILMDTFSLNPTPQMIKPLIDLYANKDSFTGAPIESAGMQNLSKQERVNNRTSGIAIALGGVSEGAAKVLTFDPNAQGFSPIQIDYAIKAYLGWAGATAASVADEAVEPFTEGTKVRPPIMDRLAMGFVKTEPETQSKFMTDFYTNNARIQSALADMRHYAELGDSEKVGKILTEQGDDIALAKLYDKTSKQLADLRKQMRLIENSKDIPTEDKRLEMNRLRILMSQLTEQVETIRKDLKKR